ncbi:hypothetical protein HYALB_00011385 [Hymenoscyphus albidus]|uniref:DUF6604 domain-containing protein n=1 Tax=Hymenoscyphus albidus TaxID=595503 RepID=A0A9N9Q3Z1_9HELO|nr:hypothetical protein HYALB_00011385 [Hymenoscyphus albidus]
MSEFRILDTYKAYKTREKKFSNWLRETASKIGINKTTPKASGKDGNENLRISDIPSIEASHFYKSRGDRVSDDGHLHYFTVLEDALQTLELSKSAKSWSKTGKSSGSMATSSSTIDVSYGNVFDVLPIESVQNVAAEAPESEDNASDPESEKEKRKAPKRGRGKKKSGKNKGKGKKPAKTTEKAITIRQATEVLIETGLLNDLDEEEDDLCFMIYCFFKDFNTMREYIQERWCDYQEGLLSLSTVAVITNTAYELLQRGERELLEMLPRRHPLRDFKNMADILFTESGLAHIDYDEKKAEFEGDEEGLSDSIAKEADWICLDRYWDLTQWLENAPPYKIVFDPTSVDNIPDYGSGKGRDKMAADKKVMMEILAEGTVLKSKKTRNPTVKTLPGEDEFTNGIVQFHATRRIQTWFVFACQIYCDIQYILATNARNCHGELRVAGTRFKRILTDYAEFQKDFEYKQDRNIKITLLELDCWIFRDLFANEKDRIREIHSYTGPMEEHSFMRRNPVLCGLMTFRFALTMNELGIKYANMWGAITAAGHPYSAMQHTTPNLPRWHDLDTLLQIHTTPYFFWDDIPPSTPSGFASSYEKASNISKSIADRQVREQCGE